MHGRVAATPANDGGFGTSDGLLMTEITSMLDWRRKLNVAVDASPCVANVLIDRRTAYARVVPFLYTISYGSVSDWNIVVRTPDGLGVVRISPGRGAGNGLLMDQLCIVDGGLVFMNRRDGGVVGGGCVFRARGPAVLSGEDGLDLTAFRACFEKLEGFPPDAPAPTRASSIMELALLVPSLAVVVSAEPDVPFERVMRTRLALEGVGLSVSFGKTCGAARN